MPFEEKITWVSVVVGFLVPATYFVVVLPQLATPPPPRSPTSGPW